MSDDLISRKALLKELREIMDEPHNTMFLMGIGAAISVIEHADTAFDKEKVIEELRNPDNYTIMAGKHVTTIDRSVEIIEKGGIE